MAGTLFFVHIPKTAGTTLNQVFADNFAAKDILSVYEQAEHERYRAMGLTDLGRFSLVQGHVFIPDYEPFFEAGIFFLTFLREPISRVISEYRFLRSWPDSQVYSLLNEADVSLADYVESDHPALRFRGRNAMAASLSGVVENEEEMFERARDNLSRFLFFGLMERFDESLVMLAGAAGLESIFYEKRNVRRENGGENGLDRATMDILRAANRVDIRLFEWAAAEFEKRAQAMGPGFPAAVRTFARINEKYRRVSDLIMQRSGEEDPRRYSK